MKGGDGGEKFGTKRIRTQSRTREQIWEHRKQHSVRFRTAVVHVLPQTASVLHKTYAIYIAWQGRLPRFSRRTPWKEPSNINIPSPNRSSEPPLVLGVLRRSKSLHTGHYSSRKGFRVRNLDTATMASLFFCCLARWESKTALSGLLSAFPVCLDRHRASEREKREGKRASRLIWRHVRDKHFALKKKEERIKPGSLSRGLVFDN